MVRRIENTIEESIRLNAECVAQSGRADKVGTYSLCALSVITIVTLQHVGEEKQFEHKKQYEQLHQYEYPQIPADRHAAESITVKAIDPSGKCSYPAWCDHVSGI